MVLNCGIVEFEILFFCNYSVVIAEVNDFFKFLGVLEKLRKATINFVISALPSFRPSVRMEQLGSHSTDFHESLWLCIFRKTVEKI
jgi:hypothetical protein